MNHPRQINHAVRQGDTLYRLARQYRTTVSAILSQNSGVDPYNLRVGSTLAIYPGKGYSFSPGRPAPAEGDGNGRITLINDMRLVWEQHVYWTRMLLISIAARLRDEPDVTARLLRNPHDIALVFSAYYAPEATDAIARLMTEHLQIGGAIITALRDGRAMEAEELTRKWYANADRMAEAFAAMNPYYSRGELQRMLYRHLDLTTKEVQERLAGNYRADIEAFDRVEQEALTMADYFSFGLMAQFPQRFL